MSSPHSAGNVGKQIETLFQPLYWCPIQHAGRLHSMDIHGGIHEIVGFRDILLVDYKTSRIHGSLQDVSFAFDGFVQVSRNHDVLSTVYKDSATPSNSTKKQTLYGQTKRPIGMACLDTNRLCFGASESQRFPSDNITLTPNGAIRRLAFDSTHIVV